MSLPTCSICGGALEVRHPRVLDPDSGEPFAIWGCLDCGLGHTWPRPDDIDRYYGADYHGDRHGFTASFRARRRLQLVEAATGRPGVVLDVGCGEGTFLELARQRGWRVAGTELGGPAAAARARGLEVHETLSAAAGTQPFTCATLWHSLEHLPDPGAALRAVAGILEPAGILVVAVPDAQGWQARLFGPKWFHLDVPRHLHHFGAPSLRRALELTGFEVVREAHQELEYDLMGWLQSTLNLVIPAPNLLFRRLTGKGGPGGPLALGLSAGLGMLTGPWALPATAAGTLAGRGGTLVMVARKRPG